MGLHAFLFAWFTGDVSQLPTRRGTCRFPSAVGLRTRPGTAELPAFPCRAARWRLRVVEGSLLVAARVAGAVLTTSGNTTTQVASSRALSSRLLLRPRDVVYAPLLDGDARACRSTLSTNEITGLKPLWRKRRGHQPPGKGTRTRTITIPYDTKVNAAG